MTKRYTDDPEPTWQRLPPTTWAMVRAEYLAGAKARDLARKYGTSPSSVYRHACKEGWTKQSGAIAVDQSRRAALEAPAPAVALDTDSMAQAARRLLADALAHGRANEARVLLGVIDGLDRRGEEEELRARAAAAASNAESKEARRARDEREMVEAFRYASMIAWHMAFNPKGAPAVFQDLIAEWRRAHFGEGDDESIARAKENAAATRRYFDLPGRAWPASLAELEQKAP